MRSIVSRNLYLPLSQWLKGESIAELLPHLERSQWTDSTSLAILQNQRLVRMLQAAMQAPWYRERWQAAGVALNGISTMQDLAALPVLTRDDVRIAGPKLVVPGFRDRQIETQTSGSSGTPLRILQSREFRSWHEAGQWRARRWYGLELGCPTAVMWGRPVRSRQEKLVNDLKFWLNNMMSLSAFDLAPATIEQGWKKLRRFRPRLVYAYPSALNAVAVTALERGWPAPDPPPAVVMTTAETLQEHERVNLQSAFRAPVCNVYGCAELGAFAHECPQGGLHVSAENVVVEILHEGKPVPLDEEGDVTLTSLNELGMPLIRYQNGDTGRLLSRMCPCGRTLPLMDLRVGKVVEIVHTSSGRVFSSALFDYISKRLVAEGQATVRFRAVQRRIGAFTVLIVPAGDTNLAHVERVFREVLDQQVGDVELTVEVVDSLPRDPGGKLRFFVNEMVDSTPAGR
ncbi:MAG: phenylacetate--CoA ligase family protein [Candidatus Xenobia bacterium]